MPTITAIEPQKKRENRFNVFVNGQFAFVASAETMYKEHLQTNQEIAQPAIDRLITENEVSLLLEKTYAWLGMRLRSEKELIDYLHKYNPKSKQPKSERAIELVIEKVKRLGYVDDKAFATWYIESRNRSRPRGRRLLQLELMKKGIDKELIGQILSESSSISKDNGGQAASEFDLALKVAQKKLTAYRNLDDRTFYQKMGAYLGRRGFDWDTIKAVMKKIRYI